MKSAKDINTSSFSKDSDCVESRKGGKVDHVVAISAAVRLGSKCHA